jgi:hypothetical protein
MKIDKAIIIKNQGSIITMIIMTTKLNKTLEHNIAISDTKKIVIDCIAVSIK